MWCLAIALILFFVASEGSALPAFPDARGCGAHSVGGSGRHLSPRQTRIFLISNLNNDGQGSLRECVEYHKPRVCLFEIAGRIDLKREMRVLHPYLTIAGETAPSPGILVTGAGMRIEASHVVVRHLEIRVGDALEGPAPGIRDGISIGSSRQEAAEVVVDHVSVSWAIDENVSTWYPSTNRITISNSIIAEGLQDSLHPKGGHSKGLMIGDGSTCVTAHHNLLAHNFERNPYVKPGSKAEFSYNLVYNWGADGGWNIANVSDNANVDEPVKLDFMGNYYKPGPDSYIAAPLYGRNVVDSTRIFVKGNIGPTRMNAHDDEWDISSLGRRYRAGSRLMPDSGLRYTDGVKSFAKVLALAGARPSERNDVDARIVREVREGRGAIPDCIQNCSRAVGGWPLRGVQRRVLDLPKSPHGDTDGDGYTDLEEMLHSYAEEVTEG